MPGITTTHSPSPSEQVFLAQATQHVAPNVSTPDGGLTANEIQSDAPQSRRRRYTSMSMQNQLSTLNDIHISSKIFGYLDRTSRLNFKEVSKCAHNLSDRVTNFITHRIEQLSAAQRTTLFNQLLRDHHYQSPELQALIKLGEGGSEIGALQTAYAERSVDKLQMPFVHWCLLRSLETRDPRPLQLALSLPDTDVNAMFTRDDNESFSALQYLAFYHYQPAKQDIVRALATALISHPNIDVNVQSDLFGSQVTALIAAMHGPNVAVIEELAKHPALDWNLTDPETQTTVLHDAAADVAPKSKVGILAPYLSKLNLDAQNAYGNTPLHDAVIYTGNAESVRRLLEAGADPTIKNLRGRTAHEEAEIRNKTDLLPLFQTPPAQDGQ